MYIFFSASSRRTIEIKALRIIIGCISFFIIRDCILCMLQHPGIIRHLKQMRRDLRAAVTCSWPFMGDFNSMNAASMPYSIRALNKTFHIFFSNFFPYHISSKLICFFSECVHCLFIIQEVNYFILILHLNP